MVGAKRTVSAGGQLDSGNFLSETPGKRQEQKCMLGLKGTKCHGEEGSTGHQEAQDRGELELESRQATPPSTGSGVKILQ